MGDRDDPLTGAEVTEPWTSSTRWTSGPSISQSRTWPAIVVLCTLLN